MVKSLTSRVSNNKRGFSIGEMMVATVLILLVSSIVAVGVGFAVRNYNKVMSQLESKMLCSTLSNIIRNELTNTSNISLGDAADDGRGRYVDAFFSTKYASENVKYAHLYSVTDGESGAIPLGEEEYGELMLGKLEGSTVVGNRLLSSASYTLYNLGAYAVITYDDDAAVYHVLVSVGKDSEEMAKREFDVIPLNGRPEIKQ